MSSTPRLCLLVIDGAGYATRRDGNTVTELTMPHLFSAMDRHGFAVLEAAGEAVGLEAGQVGNSEAGHLTIGAGRVVPAMIRRIRDAFEDGSWPADPGWEIARRAGKLHVVGMLSDAGVHGLSRTVVHAVLAAREAGIPEIVVHPVLDGVDSQAGTAPAMLAGVQARLADVPRTSFGVVIGRKWFADRSGNAEVSRVAVDALLGRTDLPSFREPLLRDHLETSGESDFPAHRFEAGATIAEGEPVLITSHRADRMRQIAREIARTQPLLTIVEPGADLEPDHVFFRQSTLDGGLAHELKNAGLESVRIAEKCKFPHVTFFLNGFNASLEGLGICIPSIPEASIRDQPEMSTPEITTQIVEHLQDPSRRVVVANLANVDQVGHLGSVELSSRAATAADDAFRKIADVATSNGWTLVVTSDHGNADCVRDDRGEPFGSHTESPVPLFVVPPPGARLEWSTREGSLANVAPSCLAALDLPPPTWMEAPLFRIAPA